MNKLKWYIWSIPYNSSSGGSVVLHRLAHILTELGEEAYIVADSKNPEWKGIHISHNDPKDPNGISIYPEITLGNPFRTNRVIRWLLNTVGSLGGDANTWRPNDLVYKYTKCYTCSDRFKIQGELTVMNTDTDSFVDLGNHTVGKTAYLVRKGLTKPRNAHPSDAICLDDYGSKGGHPYLVKMFNECETFISYDHATFLSVQAALCGCVSVVIPQAGVNVDKWKEEDLLRGYGRSYGFDHLDWAKNTQLHLRLALEELNKESIEQVKQLIKDCTP